MALAIDASTPALAAASNDPWTTASFTPPNNSLLVVVAMGDFFNGTPVLTPSSTGLTFRSVKRQGATSQGVVEIFTAEVKGNGGSSRTVSCTTSLASDVGGIKVYVLTGDSNGDYYVDATAGGTSTTDNLTANITTNSDGAWVLGGAVDWNSNGSPTSTDEEEAFDDADLSLVCVRKASATATAGSESLNFDAAGTPVWSWAAVAIQAGPSPTPYLVEAGALFAAASGTSITPVIPASAEADDVMLMAAMANGSTTFTTPTDWTLLGTSVESNANQSTEWYWKRHDGSETNPTSTTSATLSTTIGGYGRIYVFRDCITTGDPFEDVTMAGTPTSSTTPATASIDTTGANRLAVSLLSVDDDNTWSSGNPPSGWTAVGRVASTTGGDCMMDAITQVIPSAGNVAAATIGTMSAADFWRSLTLALIPVPTDGPISVDVDPATLTLAGVDPTAAGTGTATASSDTAALSLAGTDPAASGSGTVAIGADAAALALSGVDAALATGGASVTVDPATLSLSGVDVAAAGTGSGSIAVDTATLTLSGLTPTAAGSGSAAAALDPAVVTLTGVTPGAAGTGSSSSGVDVAVLVLAGVEVEASAGGFSVAVDPAVLALTGQDPTLTATGSGGVTVDVATLTVVGVTPALAGSGSGAVVADAATLTLVGATPVAAGSGTSSLLADAAVLTLEGVQTFIAGTEPSVLAGSTDTTAAAPVQSVRTTTARVSSTPTVGGPATSTPTVSES